MKMKKVCCPYCGHEQNIMYDSEHASCRGVFVRCKGRQCRKDFEVKINQDK
ncbi:hypothetical protein F220043C3_40980 [Enterocloster asparagiformis]|jgi:hypothetical protein|nr:MAG TPA: cysteine-rich protein [Caudoviricetes sp.]